MMAMGNLYITEWWDKGLLTGRSVNKTHRRSLINENKSITISKNICFQNA